MVVQITLEKEEVEEEYNNKSTFLKVINYFSSKEFH